METTIFIPARLESTRLAKKLLQQIGSRPMICHVIDRAKESNIENVVVATDSVEIMSALKNEGVECMMTSKEHISGSDRIYEALSKIDPKGNIKYVINLQGDLPFIKPSIIDALKQKVSESKADIITIAAPISPKDIGKISNKNVTKVAISFYDDKEQFGKAVYFSREPIPHNASTYYEHIGVYLYQRKALEKFVNLPPNTLETSEKLEQLRALANGLTIDVCVIDNPPVNVDTLEGLEQAKKEYEEKYQTV